MTATRMILAAATVLLLAAEANGVSPAIVPRRRAAPAAPASLPRAHLPGWQLYIICGQLPL